MYWQIAIDGPAGAGKSTIAKEVAKVLHCEYIDTGAMYRAVTLKALRLKINMEDETSYQFLENTSIDFHQGELYLDNEDVSILIRSIDVTNNVSLVSKFRVVREKLVSLQRQMSQAKTIIMDGRDIGTVVLPQANLKIYLNATVEVRAKRRMKEREDAGGVIYTLLQTIKEIEERDYKDSNREISPLAKAIDAVEIDTSNLNISEVITKIISLVMERGYKMENINTEKEMVKETSTEVVDEVSTEVVSSPEVVSTEESSPIDEKTPSEEVVMVKEMQLVEGTIIDIEAARGEIKKKDIVLRPARQERLVIRLENGQEGLLFRRDMVNVPEDVDLADFFMEDEKLQLVVKKIYPDGGKVLLSQILVKKREEIAKFEEVIATHGTFMAKVERIIKVGLILNYEDFPCLLPTSQINVTEEELASLVGQEMLVAPIRVDYTRIRLLVSATVAHAIVHRLEKQELLQTIKVGDIFDGVVKNIESYGAFVEISKGVEGLLHISEIEHNRIIKVEKVLAVGDNVKVQVIKLEGNHIGLSRKSLLPNYWRDFVEAKQVNDLVEGRVVEINKAGVVVELSQFVQGFLPRSEFAWERDSFIEDYVKVDDQINLKIIELDSAKKRIILSRRQTIDNPWTTLKIKSGDLISVNVDKVLTEGVKVSYKGATGFLPKGNINTGTEFNVNSEIEVSVRVFDPERTRLLVTMKEDNFVDKNHISRLLKSQEKVSNTLGDYFNLDEIMKNRKKGKK